MSSRPRCQRRRQWDFPSHGRRRSASQRRCRRPLLHGAGAERSFAFSLLEVLVVVAIIALLAAILLPSLQKAREQVRRVQCEARLRQLAFAWHDYLKANRDRFPRGITMDVAYGGQQGSDPAYRDPRPLNAYLRLQPVVTAGGEVFRCPSDEGTPDIVPSFFAYLGTSYCMNRYLVGPTDFYVYPDDPCAGPLNELKTLLPGLKRGAGMADIESRLILMGDMGWIEAVTYNEQKMLSFHGRWSWFNVAFMDGHAKHIQIRKGLLATSEYTTIPDRRLSEAASRLQRETR